MREAERNLQDSEGLLQQLRNNPPPHSHAVARFFNAPEQPESAPVLTAGAEGVAVSSLVDLVQSQSARLVSMEVETDAARRALHERKVIERAKGALMTRLGMTEEAAFRALQKASMDHNRKLLDVAEATLTLPDAFFVASGTGKLK